MNCCLGCTKRKLLCHANCEAYHKYRKQLDDIKIRRLQHNESSVLSRTYEKAIRKVLNNRK